MSDEERLKEIKGRLEKTKVYETGEESIWEDLKWTLDLVERLEKKIEFKNNGLKFLKRNEEGYRQLSEKYQAKIKSLKDLEEEQIEHIDIIVDMYDSKIQSLEAIKEKAENIDFDDLIILSQIYSKSTILVKQLHDLQQALEDYRKEIKGGDK